MHPMGFDLYTAKRNDLFPQIDAIAKSYFSVDTATSETAHGWYAKNPNVLIVAMIEDIVHGYADFLPLTPQAQKQIEERQLKEEDISPEHILAPDQIHQCRAVYFAGIAIRNRKSVLGARCMAALLAGFGHMISHVYKDAPLEFFYANPTTFSGNRLSNRMGLSPVSFQRKTMEGMDLYMLPLGPEKEARGMGLYERYHTFVTSMSWAR